MKLECNVEELKELTRKDKPEQIVCSGLNIKNYYYENNQQIYQLFGLQRC